MRCGKSSAETGSNSVTDAASPVWKMHVAVLAAHTREVSDPQVFRNQGELIRHFKGHFSNASSSPAAPATQCGLPQLRCEWSRHCPRHWRVVECLGGLEAMAIIPVALPLQRSRAVRSPQRPSIMSLTSWAGSQGPLMFNHAVLRRPASCFGRRIRSRLPRRQLRPLPLCSRGPSCEPIRRPFPCQAHTQGSNAHFRVSLRNRKS